MATDPTTAVLCLRARPRATARALAFARARVLRDRIEHERLTRGHGLGAASAEVEAAYHDLVASEAAVQHLETTGELAVAIVLVGSSPAADELGPFGRVVEVEAALAGERVVGHRAVARNAKELDQVLAHVTRRRWPVVGDPAEALRRLEEARRRAEVPVDTSEAGLEFWSAILERSRAEWAARRAST